MQMATYYLFTILVFSKEINLVLKSLSNIFCESVFVVLKGNVGTLLLIYFLLCIFIFIISKTQRYSLMQQRLCTYF